jgi:hypothetical protein
MGKMQCQSCGRQLGNHDEDDERQYGYVIPYLEPDNSYHCYDCSSASATETRDAD